MTSPEDVAKVLIDRYDGQTFSHAGQASAWLQDAIASAFRVYGDERAREAVKDLKLSCPLCGETLAARTGG